MQTKYITFEDDVLGLQHVVIFSNYIKHSDMADIMARLYARPISAGFVELSDEGPVCYGRSESLRLDSRPEIDTKLARKLFNQRVDFGVKSQ